MDVCRLGARRLLIELAQQLAGIDLMNRGKERDRLRRSILPAASLQPMAVEYFPRPWIDSKRLATLISEVIFSIVSSDARIWQEQMGEYDLCHR